MKVNIIHHDKSHNMMTDAENLSYIFKRLKEKPKVNHVHINSFKIEEASVNIFLENINLYHSSKAKYNIFIPNQQYFHKNWIETCQSFDLILCKTNYCYEIFKEFIDEEKLLFIGWRSPNIIIPSIEKDFDEWLVVYNDIFSNDLQKLLNVWKQDYPSLNIVFNGIQKNSLKRINLPNINYIENIQPEKFELLFNKCIIHLCLDEIDCFNHNVNQCQLVKSVPVVLNKGPVCEVADPENTFKVSSNKKRYREGMGSIYKYTQSDLEDTLQKIFNLSEKTLEIMGENCYQFSEKKQHIFVDRFTKKLNEIFLETKKIKFNKKEYTDEDMPALSIITPVNNLKDIFKICVLNYTSSSYDKKKIEWVIVDDSDENEDIEHLLPSEENRKRFNINYIRLNEKTNYGKKLNTGIEQSTNDCILIMNQDDFFYQNGFYNRVKELLKSEKKCVGMIQYGCFEINKYISIINTNSIILKYSERIYNGSLCFYKTFWDESRFGEGEDSELNDFFRNRIEYYGEIINKNIFVGLIHTRNEHLRQINVKEPNGCHFNFSEKLFKYVCSLDDVRKQQKIDREKEMEEIRNNADDENENENENESEIKEI